MGAEQFSDHAEIKQGESIEKVFRRLVEGACYNYGHAGYTGTIAEKSDYVTVGTVPTLDAANALIESLFNARDERVDDKWGPAGCVVIQPPDKPNPSEVIFFGWASS